MVESRGGRTSRGRLILAEASRSRGGSKLRRVVRAIVPAPVRRRLRALRREPYKIYIIRHYGLLRRAPLEALRYLIFGREIDNFTYEIANEGALATFLETALGVPAGDTIKYIAELQQDSELRDSIKASLRGRRDRNPTMPYGRRLGWYAIVRARKPRLLVETGVHDGLGSCVLLRALTRNSAEGHEGTLVSFDVNPSAGWLIPSFLRSRHELKIGPAPEGFVAALAGRPVDFFIHDSNHESGHETREFEAIWPLAAPHAVLLSDNAHAGTAFRDFCERHALADHFFKEVPRGHWYPGAGIGLATKSG